MLFYDMMNYLFYLLIFYWRSLGRWNCFCWFFWTWFTAWFCFQFALFLNSCFFFSCFSILFCFFCSFIFSWCCLLNFLFLFTFVCWLYILTFCFWHLIFVHFSCRSWLFWLSWNFNFLRCFFFSTFLFLKIIFIVLIDLLTFRFGHFIFLTQWLNFRLLIFIWSNHFWFFINWSFYRWLFDWNIIFLWVHSTCFILTISALLRTFLRWFW